MLGHLEQMRVCCVEQNDMSMFKMECMQKALQQAQSNSSDNLRVRYLQVDIFIFLLHSLRALVAYSYY